MSTAASAMTSATRCFVRPPRVWRLCRRRPCRAWARTPSPLAFELDDPGRAAGAVDDVVELLKPRFVLPGASLAVQFAAGFAVGIRRRRPASARSAGRRGIAAVEGACPATRRMPSPLRTSGDARNRIRLASELQTAVSNQELLFHYQPQFDLGSGELVGAEALMRWNHGAFGLQPPAPVHRHRRRDRRDPGNRSLGPAHARRACGAGQSRPRRADPLRLQRSVLEFTQRDMVPLSSRCSTRPAAAPNG